MALDRLKKRADFLRVAKTKIVAKTSTMLIQCSPIISVQAEQNKISVGFTASRRVGNAVKRNRAKRRLRTLANQYLQKVTMEDIPLKGVVFQFVFIAVPSTVKADFGQLLKDFTKGIRWCLSQAQLQLLIPNTHEDKTDVTLSY